MRRLVSVENATLNNEQVEQPGRFAAAAEFGERRIVVPRAVRIRDGMLEWSNEEPGWDHRRTSAEFDRAGLTPWKQGKANNKLLTRFIALATEPESAIVDFASRYGVLYLNNSGQPGGEPDTNEYPNETVIVGGLRRAPGGGMMIDQTPQIRPVQWRQEPVAFWRDWALIVRLLLLFGLKLREARSRIDPVALVNEWELDVPPYTEDNERWRFSEPRALVFALTRKFDRDSADDYRLTTLDEQRRELGGWLDLMTSLAPISLRVSWQKGEQPRTRIDRTQEEDRTWLSTDPNNVFGAIVGQLLTKLQGDTNVHICPGCGATYPCKRRSGYCPDCRAERRKATRLAAWHRHPEYNERRRKQQ